VRQFNCIALIALLAAPPHAAPQGTARPAAARPDAFATLESAGKTYRAASTVCADFKQTLSVPLLGQDVSGSGRLCTKQPNLFAMRFTQPSGDVYLADGTWMWMYTPSTDAKQVLRWRMTQGPRGVDLYREFLDAPRSKYRAEYKGKETVAGKSTHQARI
jgi:outer membrane lipoprotein-sorting protein